MTVKSREGSFTAFFKTATDGFTPYGWQVQIALDGLPDVLPVPTGLGKTEVALAWAWRRLVDKQPEPLHFVVCMSMRSLVSQTVVRLRRYFDALYATERWTVHNVNVLAGVTGTDHRESTVRVTQTGEIATFPVRRPWRINRDELDQRIKLPRRGDRDRHGE